MSPHRARVLGRIWWGGRRDCRDWTRVDARVLGIHRLHTCSGTKSPPRRVFPLTRLGGGIVSGVGAGLRGGAERSREGSRDLPGPRAKRRRRPCLFLGLPFSPGPLPSTSVLTSHPSDLLAPRQLVPYSSHLSPLGTGEAVSTELAHFSALAPPAPSSLSPAFPCFPFSYLRDGLVPTNPNLALPMPPHLCLYKYAPLHTHSCLTILASQFKPDTGPRASTPIDVS